jgi:Flp pilus assembly protein TadG
MIRAVRTFLRRWRDDRDGVSAIEFALIAPFMVALYLGAVEVSLALSIDRKITSAASALADLVAQDDVITDGEMSSIFTAGNAIVAPFDSGPMEVRISSVMMDSSGDVSVQWSDADGMPALTPGGGVSMPAGIMQTNRSVIMVEVRYSYETLFSELGVSQFDIREVFYLRPRRSLLVMRD